MGVNDVSQFDSDEPGKLPVKVLGKLETLTMRTAKDKALSVRHCFSSETRNSKLILTQSLIPGPHQCFIVCACRLDY